MRTQLLACTIATFLAIACAPRQAATTWGYSHWYRQSGVNELGPFEAQQKRCLEQIAASADPASVQPGSQDEDSFVNCMNAADWCTQAWHCSPPE